MGAEEREQTTYAIALLSSSTTMAPTHDTRSAAEELADATDEPLEKFDASEYELPELDELESVESVE